MILGEGTIAQEVAAEPGVGALSLTAWSRQRPTEQSIAGCARDITLLLLDIHAVLDQLHLDGTKPEITTADAILRESGSPYTLPGLISGLDEVISQLTRATRQALADVSPPGTCLNR